jgi:hypothetical protein
MASAKTSFGMRTFNPSQSNHAYLKIDQKLSSLSLPHMLSLNLRCPTVSFCSPQMWRIKLLIRHIYICCSILTNFIIFYATQLKKIIKNELY